MEREKEDHLLKDLSLKTGYKKIYTNSLRELINNLNWLIECETNEDLRNEYKSMEERVSKRLHGIYDMFHQLPRIAIVFCQRFPLSSMVVS